MGYTNKKVMAANQPDMDSLVSDYNRKMSALLWFIKHGDTQDLESEIQTTTQDLTAQLSALDEESRAVEADLKKSQCCCVKKGGRDQNSVDRAEERAEELSEKKHSVQYKINELLYIKKVLIMKHTLPTIPESSIDRNLLPSGLQNFLVFVDSFKGLAATHKTHIKDLIKKPGLHQDREVCPRIDMPVPVFTSTEAQLTEFRSNQLVHDFQKTLDTLNVQSAELFLGVLYETQFQEFYQPDLLLYSYASRADLPTKRLPACITMVTFAILDWISRGERPQKQIDFFVNELVHKMIAVDVKGDEQQVLYGHGPFFQSAFQVMHLLDMNDLLNDKQQKLYEFFKLTNAKETNWLSAKGTLKPPTSIALSHWSEYPWSIINAARIYLHTDGRQPKLLGVNIADLHDAEKLYFVREVLPDGSSRTMVDSFFKYFSESMSRRESIQAIMPSVPSGASGIASVPDDETGDELNPMSTMYRLKTYKTKTDS